MARLLGAHVVGMTGYPEVALARELGLEFVRLGGRLELRARSSRQHRLSRGGHSGHRRGVGEVVSPSGPRGPTLCRDSRRACQVRTIDWTGNAIQIIDQTALPNDVRVLTLDTIDALVDAIGRLAVRGAPALGAAGALGVALSVVLFDGDQDRVRSAASLVRDARPTAVNLAWGVDRALGVLDNGVAAVVAEALAVLSEDAAYKPPYRATRRRTDH